MLKSPLTSDLKRPLTLALQTRKAESQISNLLNPEHLLIPEHTLIPGLLLFLGHTLIPEHTFIWGHIFNRGHMLIPGHTLIPGDMGSSHGLSMLQTCNA